MATLATTLRPVAARGAFSSSSPSATTTSLLKPRAFLAAQRPPPPSRQTGSVRHKSGPYGYTQAKALYFSRCGEPADVLRLHTHSISPTLPAGTALVRTLAAPINPADVNGVQGTYGTPPTFSSRDLGTPDPAAVPGSEGVFEVLATGSGVSALRPGDWAIPAVAGVGTFRTHALVERADVALQRVGDKEGLTPVQVATASVNPCSAYRMLRDFVDLVGLSVQQFRERGSSGEDAPTGGAWFLQNGANSGVGRAAVQLGRRWGLRSINVVRERETPEATEALRAELMGLGATVVVTEREFLGREFRRRLADEWTRGGREPLMLGLNCVGGASASQVVKCLAPGGAMVTYGNMSRQSFAYPSGLQIFRGLRFFGFWLTEWSRQNPEAKRATVEEILELMRKGEFQAAPVQEIRWDWDTEEKVLRDAVQGTLEGFRPGKGVFVFGDT